MGHVDALTARQSIFHPEDRARTSIDSQLAEAGWLVQSREEMNRSAGLGVAVRELPTASGPVDYALFVGGTLCGVVEAKPEGTTLSGFADQAARYMSGVPEHLVRRERQVRFEYVASGTESCFATMPIRLHGRATYSSFTAPRHCGAGSQTQ
jgi:type I restriction enzyme R subunit